MFKLAYFLIKKITYFEEMINFFITSWEKYKIFICLNKLFPNMHLRVMLYSLKKLIWNLSVIFSYNSPKIWTRKYQIKKTIFNVLER